MKLLSNFGLLPAPRSPPQQMSVLDFFFPGFTNITSAANQAFGGKLTGYTFLLCIVALVPFLKPYVLQLKYWFINHCTSTIYIESSDETYHMVQKWISSQKLDDSARSIRAKVITKQDLIPEHERYAKKPIRYAPWRASQFFWYKKNLLCYQTTLVTVGFHEEEKISVTCAGRPRVLKRFLEDCRIGYLVESMNKTTIYRHRGDCWRREKAVAARPLDTVILNKWQKRLLVKDLEEFLDPITRGWYTERSIPYRRGYLLHGPPGTGKSSFSLSVAGELNMDIYIVRIPGTDDQTLEALFSAVPARSVVLLEDIDAAGAVCSRDPQPGKSDDDKDSGIQRRGVTLSGLLNVLDGVASQEDRVLIMTTNHPEKLDQALTRPGRVDKVVEFQLADRTMAKEIYHFMFRQQKNMKGGDLQVSNEEVDRFGNEFAEKVPEFIFSPAEIMSFLLPHRSFPAAALENCDQWVKSLVQMKEARKEGIVKA